MGIKQRRRSTRTILKWKSKIQVNPRGVVRLYKWYKAKTFCCAFFAAAMLTMVAAATIVRFPPVSMVKLKFMIVILSILQNSPIEAWQHFENDIVNTVEWHWRHGVSNHWPIDCLFNRLCRLTTKQTQKLCITDPLWGEPPCHRFYRGNIMATDDLATQGAATSQTVFSDAFAWIKSSVFWVRLHWSLSLRVQLIITQH